MVLDWSSSQNLKRRPHVILKREKSDFFSAKVFKRQARLVAAASDV
jgi:hypothetical protein